MIPAAATPSTVSHSQAAGKAHGIAASAAGAGSFSALLDGSGSVEEAPAEAPSATDPAANTAVAALLLPVAVGNAGKASGKTLPGTPTDIAPDTEGDAESATAADGEATSLEVAPDQAVIALALASVLPLPQHPLDGAATGAPVPSQSFGTASGPAARLMAGTAAIATAPASSQQAIAAMAAQAEGQVQARTSTNGAANATGIPDVALAPVTIIAEQPAAPSARDATPAIAAQLATRPQLAASAPVTQQRAAEGHPPETPQAVPQAQTMPEAQAQAHAQAQAAQALQEDGTVEAASRQSGADFAGSDPSDTRAAKIAARLQNASASEQVSSLARMTEPAPIAAAVQPLSDTASAPAPVSTSSASAAVEGPQDFSTLVSRLAEAREAANPHVVRTAINHAEFGQISLQFRHEDNGLSVTMANADPGFAGAVQAAASASFAGGSNGSDTPQQQQQHPSASAQNQAGANSAGAGMGNGQNSQARADQAGQSSQHGQGTASLPHDQEASAPRQSRDGTRNAGGIYA